MLKPVALLAEFIGTFALTLAVLMTAGNALAVGGSLAVITALIGKVSGAHVNPAVSLAMFAKGSLSQKEVAAYIFSQVAGGLGALYAVRTIG
jgi:aquaporin Z